MAVLTPGILVQVEDSELEPLARRDFVIPDGRARYQNYTGGAFPCLLLASNFRLGFGILV